MINRKIFCKSGFWFLRYARRQRHRQTHTNTLITVLRCVACGAAAESLVPERPRTRRRSSATLLWWPLPLPRRKEARMRMYVRLKHRLIHLFAHSDADSFLTRALLNAAICPSARLPIDLPVCPVAPSGAFFAYGYYTTLIVHPILEVEPTCQRGRGYAPPKVAETGGSIPSSRH